MVRIGFGMRFVAGLIDGVILMVAYFILHAILPLRLFLILFPLISLAYTSLEVIKAGTLGKLLLKFRITNQDGTAAPMDKLLKRWAYKQSANFISLLAGITMISLLSLLSLPLVLLIVVGCFFALRPDHLALHDQWFGTAVYGPGTVTAPGFPVQPTPPTA